MVVLNHRILPAALLLLLVSGCFHAKRPHKGAKNQVTAPVELLNETDVVEEVPDTLAAEEVDPPIIHVIYNEKVHGFSVSIDFIPGEIEDTLRLLGQAKIHFLNDDTSFVIENDWYHLSYFKEFPGFIKKTQETTFFPKYIRRPQGKYLFDANPFYFADMDFDGEDELVLPLPAEGPRGATWYKVFELDGTERKDLPLGDIDDWTIFDRKAETITLDKYYGLYLDSYEMVYKHQGNGQFILTDSTTIVFGHTETSAFDSIRYHYRVVDGEMILYETIHK